MMPDTQPNKETGKMKWVHAVLVTGMVAAFMGCSTTGGGATVMTVSEAAALNAANYRIFPGLAPTSGKQLVVWKDNDSNLLGVYTQNTGKIALYPDTRAGRVAPVNVDARTGRVVFDTAEATPNSLLSRKVLNLKSGVVTSLPPGKAPDFSSNVWFRRDTIFYACGLDIHEWRGRDKPGTFHLTPAQKRAVSDYRGTPYEDISKKFTTGHKSSIVTLCYHEGAIYFTTETSKPFRYDTRTATLKEITPDEMEKAFESAHP